MGAFSRSTEGTKNEKYYFKLSSNFIARCLLWVPSAEARRELEMAQNKSSGLPLLAMEKLMKDKGASRVSEDAKEELKKILEQYLYDISLKASKISGHSGRKTINGGDLLIARE